ncbi:MAG: vWA domain-containing protein [Fimbriimonadaceae bacterium]
MGGVSFQSPLALLWFLPVGGFILALYLLRLRRRDFMVPASFLWPERQDEVRANSLFQKLKFNWLWVLQLLALLALVLGLARWQMRQENVQGLTSVLIVDASASMGATDVTPDRFRVAVKRAEELVKAMKPGDRMALIEAGSNPKVLVGLSDDPAKLRQGVESLKRGDAPSDVGESLRLAMALVGRDAESRIVLLSDGCFDSVGAVARGKSQILFEPIGAKSDNLGIQALGTAQTPAGLQGYVGVKNFGLAQANSALTVYADGKSVFSERVTVGPGQTVGRTVKLPGDAEIVQAKLDEGGFLKSDDIRWVPGDPAGSLRVLLITKGNLFLETGLSLDARVVLDKSATVPTTEKADSSGGGNYDLVIFDSLPEVAVKAPMVVTFGVGGGSSPVQIGGKVRSPEVVSVQDKGLLDGVSFEGVYLEDVYSVKPKAGAQALAKTVNGPLVVSRENPKKQVYFAFDLLNGDFPLSVSFPIVLGNIVDLASGSNKAGISNLVTGQTVGIPAKDGATLLVKQPDGSEILSKALNGRFTLRNFDQVGEYQVGEGEGAKRYLVNMISDRESTIAPVAEFAVAGGDAVKAKPMERFADLWKPLIAVMMGLLVLEWFVFMRRS